MHRQRMKSHGQAHNDRQSPELGEQFLTYQIILDTNVLTAQQSI